MAITYADEQTMRSQRVVSEQWGTGTMYSRYFPRPAHGYESLLSTDLALGSVMPTPWKDSTPASTILGPKLQHVGVKRVGTKDYVECQFLEIDADTGIDDGYVQTRLVNKQESDPSGDAYESWGVASSDDTAVATGIPAINSALSDGGITNPYCAQRSFDKSLHGRVLVRCVWRVKTEGALLVPRQGIMRISSMSQVRLEDAAEVTVKVWLTVDETTYNRLTLRARRATHVMSRTIYEFKFADNITYFDEWLTKLAGWRGTAGTLTFYANGSDRTVENVKLDRYSLCPRAANMSIIDGALYFVENPDGWATDGIIEDEWYGVDSDGNQVVGWDPAVPDPTVVAGVKLRKQDLDVVSSTGGTFDLTDVGIPAGGAADDFFAWWSTPA